MPPTAPAEPLLHHLWLPGADGERPEVFALLDGARHPQILTALRRSRLDHRCLFEGRVAPALAVAAPYLVHLAPRARLSRELLKQGWGESWGVFLRSRAILQELHRHFRELLMVEDPTGKHLFFRFYDPRVLRVYLPTCTPGELEQVFGPVDSFCLESEEGDALLECSFDRRRLQVRRLELA